MLGVSDRGQAWCGSTDVMAMGSCSRGREGQAGRVTSRRRALSLRLGAAFRNSDCSVLNDGPADVLEFRIRMWTESPPLGSLGWGSLYLFHTFGLYSNERIKLHGFPSPGVWKHVRAVQDAGKCGL